MSEPGMSDLAYMIIGIVINHYKEIAAIIIGVVLMVWFT